MAAPTNLYGTDTLRGNAEDVDNKIYNLDPEETPFISSLKSEKVDAKTFQWQEDTYAAPNANNAVVEGDEFAGEVRTPTFMLRNTIQTFRKAIVTSGVANAIRKYGRDEEQDYQMRKAAVELRKDIEAATLSDNGGVVLTPSVQGKLAGLGLYANLNAQHGVGGSTAALTNDTLPTTAPTAGTGRALTEAIFTQAMRTMWEAGPSPKTVFLTMTQKNAVNQFAGIATRRVDVPPKGFASIIGAVDIYAWEEGPVAFVPVRSDRLNNNRMYITDNESIKRTYLRPISRMKMGKTGDNVKEMLITDASLKVTNRRGIIKIADLS